jgi:hypothetical protein
VTVLFVAATRRFDDVSDQHVEFESIEALPATTHLGSIW